MADDNAKEPGAGTAQETQEAASVRSETLKLGAEDLMPGLYDAVEAEVTVQVQAEVAALRDKLLRALAETENVRRRAERDRKDAEAYGGTRLARDLLAVHDNLDRALAHVDDSLRAQGESFIEGVELTQRELLNAFAKHKIEKIVPAPGEKFDPHRHQAMFEAPIPGAEPGTVIEVMQAGFTIADRLLRPAMVGVARAVPQAAAAEKAAETAPEAGDST